MKLMLWVLLGGKDMYVKPDSDPSPELPSVSIIIPAHNEAKHIAKCLESLQELDYPCFEIILVDDGSTDGTSVIASEFQSKFSNLFIIRSEKKHGSAYARNQGAKQARFEILAFLDADCVADRNWLKFLVSKMVETGTCASGSIKPANLGISRWGDEEIKRISAHWMKEYPRIVARGFKPNLSGIFGIQRTMFDEIGKFDENLPRRVDGDYLIRLTARGIKIAFAPSAVVSHHYPTSLKSYYRRGVSVAKATYLLNQKYGDPFRDTFRKRVHETLYLMVSIVLLVILVIVKEYLVLPFINLFVVFDDKITSLPSSNTILLMIYPFKIFRYI